MRTVIYVDDPRLYQRVPDKAQQYIAAFATQGVVVDVPEVDLKPKTAVPNRHARRAEAARKRRVM